MKSTKKSLAYTKDLHIDIYDNIYIRELALSLLITYETCQKYMQ